MQPVGLSFKQSPVVRPQLVKANKLNIQAIKHKSNVAVGLL